MEEGPHLNRFPWNDPAAFRERASIASASVLIASPGAAVREQLREKLPGQLSVHEVSQWDSLDRTISSLTPDVVLLDIDLLRLSGIEDFSIIRRISRKSRIVLLSSTPSESEGVRALKAGVRGYCQKEIEAPVLRKVVECVRDGEVWAERKADPAPDRAVFLPSRRAPGGARPRRPAPGPADPQGTRNRLDDRRGWE